MAIMIAGSGKKGAGKTLFGNPYLASLGFKMVNFADYLKHRCRADFSLTPEHTDGNLKEVPVPKLNGKTPRELMIAVGKLYREFSDGGNYWLNKALDDVGLKAPDQYVYIGDCRFKNEADAIRRKGGIIIRLERDAHLNIYEPSNDPSECDLDDYDFDVTLGSAKNRTPQDLERFANEIKHYCDKTKDKCKGDYSRFNILFRDCWNNRS